MNIPFDIGSGTGPVIFEPIRTMEVSEPVPMALSECQGTDMHMSACCVRVW